MLARPTLPLIKRLPAVRGKLIANASLRGLTWFRTGGKAEVLFKPADTLDLQTFRRELDPRINVTVLGLGSNVLVRDGGVEGVVMGAQVFAREGVEKDSRALEIEAQAIRVSVFEALKHLLISGNVLIHLPTNSPPVYFPAPFVGKI